MKNKIKIVAVFLTFICLFFNTSCGKKYVVKYMDGTELVKEIEVKNGEQISNESCTKEGYTLDGWYIGDEKYDFNEKVTNDLVLNAKWKINSYTITFNSNGGSDVLPITADYKTNIQLPISTKDGYTFSGWYLNDELCNNELEINSDCTLVAKWDLIKADFEIAGNVSLYDNSTTKLIAKHTSKGAQATFEWKIENESIVDFDDLSKTSATLFGVRPGTTNVTLIGTYPDGTIKEVSVEIVVLGQTFDLSYELNENDNAIMPSDAPSTYNTGELPLELPLLTRDHYVFAGWLIEGYDGVFKLIDFEDEIEGNLVLTPKWIYPHLELQYENNQVIVEKEGTSILIVNPVDLDSSEYADGYLFESMNEKIAEINSDGTITGVSVGYTELKVTLKSNKNINASIGITVVEDAASMSEVLNYFASVAKSSNVVKNINVTGWQRIYTHELRTSVIGYLFEDLVITENIAPIGGNRPGTVFKKHYICVHDTGDVDYSAKDWSETVYNNFNALTGKSYGASYQYVIDNKDCYHNIPDNERSYHAGDGNRTYEEIPSGVYGTEKYPKITITDDGYYAIDGKKSTILAPTYNGQILKTKDINDYGIRCVIRDGQYYLGKTWYDTTYRKIGNYGGNNNSIGIESCITQGDDVYYTWQRLAKLVAKLMDENDLTIDDVVTHHYFSGKNCPQTMREAGFYLHFKELVQIEYQVLQFVKQGYKVSFESGSPEYVNSSGRVIKTTPVSKIVNYTIKVEKNSVVETLTLTTTVQNTPF